MSRPAAPHPIAALRDAAAAAARDPGRVHIFHANLAPPPAAVAACRAVLSPQETARGERYAFEHLRRRFAVRRGLLREILSAVVGVAPAALRFVTGPYGKPALDLPDAPHFNLSDSEDDMVLALCHAHPVGIDVELLRTIDDADALAAHVFSPAELAAYRSLAEAARPRGFFRTWTAKEAVIKALGKGLSQPLASFDVDVAQERPARLLRLEGDDPAHWRLLSLDLGPQLVTTLAARAPSLCVKIWA